MIHYEIIFESPLKNYRNMKGSNRDVIDKGILHLQDAIEAGFYKKIKYISIVQTFLDAELNTQTQPVRTEEKHK